MEKKIEIDNKEIKYIIKKSGRAKRLRLAVHGDSSVVITIPRGITERTVEKFLREKADWILKKIEYFKNVKRDPGMKYSKKDYLKNKDKAREIIEERVKYFNQIYKYKFNRISVKNQKTRWGSCSKQGNLNFNYKIIYLSEKQLNYIIVHELCHLKELNHSRKFWNLVARVLPDYQDTRKGLRAVK